MSNSKLLSYKDVVYKLKQLEGSQRLYKRILSRETRSKEIVSLYQTEINQRKGAINILLSLIDIHKKARKMYSVLKRVCPSLGMSTQERSEVESILNA